MDKPMIKWELLEVYPPTPGWINLSKPRSSEEWLWEPIWAMARVRITNWDAEGATSFETISPLVYNGGMPGMGLPDQARAFGGGPVEDDSTFVSSEDVIHWSKVAEFLQEFPVRDLEGLMIYVRSFYNK